MSSAHHEYCCDLAGDGFTLLTNDHSMRNIQPMQVICPQCQARYELESEIVIDGLICQRCGHEFCAHSDGESHRIDCVTAEDVFPERRPVRLLPWFVVMLLLIAASVLWWQYDTWIEQRWFRSSVINLGIPLPQRDQDWCIPPASVHSRWMRRTDGSKVLLVQGQVNNLLSSAMLPPNIEMVFFSKSAPDQRMDSLLLDFTYPPSRQVMMQTPYQIPNVDNNPIKALATRKFMFLIDALPLKWGDFSLNVRSR